MNIAIDRYNPYASPFASGPVTLRQYLDRYAAPIRNLFSSNSTRSPKVPPQDANEFVVSPQALLVQVSRQYHEDRRKGNVYAYKIIDGRMVKIDSPTTLGSSTTRFQRTADTQYPRFSSPNAVTHMFEEAPKGPNHAPHLQWKELTIRQRITTHTMDHDIPIPTLRLVEDRAHALGEIHETLQNSSPQIPSLKAPELVDPNAFPAWIRQGNNTFLPVTTHITEPPAQREITIDRDSTLLLAETIAERILTTSQPNATSHTSSLSLPEIHLPSKAPTLSPATHHRTLYSSRPRAQELFFSTQPGERLDEIEKLLAGISPAIDEQPTMPLVIRPHRIPSQPLDATRADPSHSADGLSLPHILQGKYYGGDSPLIDSTMHDGLIHGLSDEQPVLASAKRRVLTRQTLSSKDPNYFTPDFLR